MTRLSIQIIFVMLGIAWMLFVTFDLFTSIYGDCAGDRWCEGRKSIAGGLVFWRGFCVTLLIFLAYRFFRKEPDV
ncbi:MAG TPA: hypothetical protein VF589_06695 [Allosphingosinicella sp.]